MATQETKTRKAYRQGELLFLPLSEQELGTLYSASHDGSYPRWNRLATTVIREGETTGHKHEALAETRGAVTLLEPERQIMPGLPDMASIASEDRLLLAEEPVRVVHPEHKPLRLGKGAYLVIVQREYDEVKARRILD